MRRGRLGFTLVEVLVAVVLSAVVALLGHQLFGAAVDGAARLRASRLAVDRDANARRLLRAAFLSLEIGADTTVRFSGEPDRVRFHSWLPTKDGWLEPATVELRLEGKRWVAMAPPYGRVTLAEDVSAIELDYLLEPGADARWVRSWESRISAPLAVRARVTRGAATDTMLYLIRARG